MTDQPKEEEKPETLEFKSAGLRRKRKTEEIRHARSSGDERRTTMATLKLTDWELAAIERLVTRELSQYDSEQLKRDNYLRSLSDLGRKLKAK